MPEHFKEFVIINGEKFYHGDSVIFKATPNDPDEEHEDDYDSCIGRLSILEQEPESTSIRFHVCQNKHDGDSIEDKLGYDYSWVVNVKDGKIISTDTDYIRRYVEELKTCNPCDVSNIFDKESETINIFEADDIMPENWNCDDELIKIKKELDESI